MAKRRVNKNLVAFVTIAGVGLAAIVVAIAAYNLSRRDPAAIALKAKAQEESDPRRAIRLYQNAFTESKEATYLLESARVAREMGDLSTMFGLLNLAYTQSPDDQDVLNALLVRYWEIRDYYMGQWRDVQERATKVCSKEPNNLLALASLAEALVWLRDDETLDEQRASIGEALEWLTVEDASVSELVDQILARADQVDPTSSYVALVRAKRTQLLSNERVRELLQRAERASFDDIDDISKQATAERVDYLQPALEAHPDDVPLRIACAQALADQQQWPVSRELLGAGLEAKSDDPDLHYEMARTCLGETRQLMRDAAEEARVAAQGRSGEEVRLSVDEAARGAVDLTLLAEGLGHVNQALELEPALYRAYTLRGDLQRLGWIADGSWQQDPQDRQKKILESYAAALDGTVGLESFRAMLARFRLERLELIAAGFENALNFYRGTDSTEAIRSQALTYMRTFLQQAQTQYPERPQTSLMEGYLAMLDGQQLSAIRAFTQAEDDAEWTIGGVTPPLARLAREELAKLYYLRGELGTSLDYATQVVNDYRDQQLTPPSWLFLQQIEILLQLSRAQDALDLAELVTPLFPDSPALKTARAKALTALDRGAEAMRELEDVPDDPRYLYEQGRIAAINGDYDTALSLLRKALEADPEHLRATDRLLRVLITLERTDEAQQLVRDRLATTTNEPLQRLLHWFELMLSESDPEARKRKLLEMIAANPDEYERASEYYGFYVSRDLQRAAEYLDQMERLRPDDLAVQRLQFEMALRTRDCPRAERCAATLARADADQMGGALYRGRYELSCGDPLKALTEFRAAEQNFPRDTKLKTFIGRALMQLTPPRYEQAIQALTEAVQADPQSFDAQKLLYACYEMTGRRTEQPAIDALEAAVERAAQLQIKDDYIEGHAQLLDEERDPQQGIADREQLRQEDPQDVTNLLRLAELYARVGDTEAEQQHRAQAESNYGLARERLEAAATVEPGNPHVARFAVRFFAAREDRVAGEALLRKHIEAQQGLGEIAAHGLLGRFYEMLGDREAEHARELNTAGEGREVVFPHRDAAVGLWRDAQSAYQRARERVPEALADASEQERRHAIVASTWEQADFYLRQSRWEEMIEACRVILDHLDPDDVASHQVARLRIVSALRSLQRMGEARDELDAFRRKFPDNLQGMMTEAELLIASGELEQARALLSRVLADAPDHVWSLYMRARIDIQRQRYTEARADLLRAKELAPESFELSHRHELARLYELMDKPELAEAELREMLPLDRGGDRGVELRLIALLKRTGQIEEAQAFVNQLIANNPKQPFWSYELGKLLMEREEYSAAVGPLRKSVELTEYKNPKPIEEWLEALIKAKRNREAIAVYESLPAGILTPSIKTNAAEAYLGDNQRDIAALLLEQALDEAGGSGIYLLRQVASRARTLLGREEVRTLLSGVTERTGDREAELRLRIMLVEFMAADSDATRRAEALEEIDALLSEIPAGTPLRFEALLVRALVLDQTGEPEQAAAVYEQALELQTNDLRALNNLAYLLVDTLGRPAEALPYAQKLHQVAGSGNVAALDTVAWVYYANGDTAQALPILLEAARLDPSHIAVRHHLGLIYADTGRKDDAEREFRRVLDLAREQQSAEYVQKAEEALARLR